MTRLFILDPVCAQAFGHNLAALRYFVGHMRQTGRFAAVTGYCAKNLALPADDTQIVPCFDFNYHNLFNIPPATVIDGFRVQSDRDYTLRSQREFAAFLARHACTAEDVLFFPSADYYGIMGVLLALQDLAPAAAPKVVLRLIGVLEFSSRAPGTGEANVTALLRDCLARGYRIEVVAETPAYASLLAVSLGTVVHVAPYPAIDEQSPLGDEAAPLVAVLGSGRFDKGFLRLKGIFLRTLDLAGDDLPLRFVVQGLPNRDALPYLKYIAELAAVPGLLLAADILSQERLSDYLRRSRVVLMPYAQDVYASRGSAMLMEALSVGRPVVAEADCGFSSQIDYYQCGTLCRTDDDYARAILAHARMDAATLNARMTQARTRFVFDSNSAYERLW